MAALLFPAQRDAPFAFIDISEVDPANFRQDIARFAARPSAPLVASPGVDFRFDVVAEILAEAEVGCVSLIERLEPGSGWENILMSREPAVVGRLPGRYAVEVLLPRMPLEPGLYQVSVYLIMPDPDLPSRRITLDGWSWLTDDGLQLEVTGSPRRASNFRPSGA